MRKRGLFRTATNLDNHAINDHIGEKTALLPDGTCAHPYMLPNSKREYCTLAGRFDVGVHHVISGGPQSKKMYRDDLANLIGSTFFQQYFSHIKDGPDSLSSVGAISKVFASEQYKAVSEKFCPSPKKNHQEMMALTVLLPGSELAVHYDNPYFMEFSRESTPVWLLVALRQSGVINENEVPQIQGVAYIHGNETNPYVDGGDFVFWPHGPKGEKYSFRAKHNSAIIVDGVKTAHGVETFRPNSKAFIANKDKATELRYKEGETWELFEDGKFIRTFDESEIRIGVVWRTLCLDDENQYETWRKTRNDKSSQDAVEILKKKLKEDGKPIPSDPVELAKSFVEAYVEYPFGDGIIPYNFCALTEIIPQNFKSYAKMLLDPLCKI
ncbi:Oidioi.mRNA.OKI2018_I69.PAR.g8491.t1.cds [Oikopleura dioica]|uniref:Oidioi.mRNA.OKI2018_I69.PAR.g8491.t1.cds n=1 Tax=Oikopleura dioica TaxID=34765 RepID=A0ABN7RG91_OIKDI|nr:Oidioi.mRNA.OKI2018_I69.PAR.g8491.t1.cds [Oikopleura dioica]